MKKYLIIGLVILLGTNLVVLGGVAYNRMGEATAHLTLTERELTLPYDAFKRRIQEFYLQLIGELRLPLTSPITRTTHRM
jgi:hypothetical protein